MAHSVISLRDKLAGKALLGFEIRQASAGAQPSGAGSKVAKDAGKIGATKLGLSKTGIAKIGVSKVGLIKPVT